LARVEVSASSLVTLTRPVGQCSECVVLIAESAHIGGVVEVLTIGGERETGVGAQVEVGVALVAAEQALTETVADGDEAVAVGQCVASVAHSTQRQPCQHTRGIPGITVCAHALGKLVFDYLVLEIDQCTVDAERVYVLRQCCFGLDLVAK